MKKMKKKTRNIRWMLVLYDAAVFILASILMFVFYEGNNKLLYMKQLISNAIKDYSWEKVY